MHYTKEDILTFVRNCYPNFKNITLEPLKFSIAIDAAIVYLNDERNTYFGTVRSQINFGAIAFDNQIGLLISRTGVLANNIGNLPGGAGSSAENLEVYKKYYPNIISQDIIDFAGTFTTTGNIDPTTGDALLTTVPVASQGAVTNNFVAIYDDCWDNLLFNSIEVTDYVGVTDLECNLFFSGYRVILQ